MIIAGDWRKNRVARKDYARECKSFPPHLIEVPVHLMPRAGLPVMAWRSRTFFVQLYRHDGQERLTMHRTELLPDGNWKDGITWDQMMNLKTQAGFGDRWAVEVFPDDREVVNVANMRHLFLLVNPPPYAWRMERA